MTFKCLDQINDDTMSRGKVTSKTTKILHF